MKLSINANAFDAGDWQGWSAHVPGVIALRCPEGREPFWQRLHIRPPRTEQSRYAAALAHEVLARQHQLRPLFILAVMRARLTGQPVTDWHVEVPDAGVQHRIIEEGDYPSSD